MGKTQVISEYDPGSEIRVQASDPVMLIPYMTGRAAEVLFANAYIRTVADVANLPKQFPGLASAFSQDQDFKTWGMILAFAEQVVNTPGGVSVNRSSFVTSLPPTTDPNESQPQDAPTDAEASGCRLM